MAKMELYLVHSLNHRLDGFHVLCRTKAEATLILAQLKRKLPRLAFVVETVVAVEKEEEVQ